MSYKRPRSQGIELKKRYGQHFLKDRYYVDTMIRAVTINPDISVMEIGCGQGILTQAILQTNCKKVQVFEIDSEWLDYVQNVYGSDKRLHMELCNVLDIDLDQYLGGSTWVLLANLPYQITFPLLYKMVKYRHLFAQGVVMIQEEVAQKIVKQTGRDYGYPSLFLQHFFELKLLDKIDPGAFYPPPQVFSRLLYFKPKADLTPIFDEENFWKFIKLCFHQPRRTLRNNLAQSHLDIDRLDNEILNKRAQQLVMSDFLQMWLLLHS